MPVYRTRLATNGNEGALFDDFMVTPSTSQTSGALNMIASVNGTSATVQGITTPDASAIGVIQCVSGTTTTGRAFISTNSVVNIRFGGGVLTTTWRFQLPTLLDATEAGAIYIGFGDSVSAAPTDGAYLYWDDTQTFFRARTRNNSTETDTSFAVAPAAGTWYRIDITVNAAATSVAFSLTPAGGATTTVTNTANIPTESGRETTILAGIIKSAGTTSRALYLDYARLAWNGFSR